jgi:hypothetical protein
MMGKQLILSRKPVDKGRLADPCVSMKDAAAPPKNAQAPHAHTIVPTT